MAAHQRVSVIFKDPGGNPAWYGGVVTNGIKLGNTRACGYNWVDVLFDDGEKLCTDWWWGCKEGWVRLEESGGKGSTQSSEEENTATAGGSEEAGCSNESAAANPFVSDTTYSTVSVLNRKGSNKWLS